LGPIIYRKRCDDKCIPQDVDMKPTAIGWLLCLGLIGLTVTAQTTNQPGSNGAAKPAEDQPLISPRSTYDFVLATVADAKRHTDPKQRDERLRRAMIAFDASLIDSAIWETEAPDYILKLVDILQRMDQGGFLQPTDQDQLPSTPTGTDGRLESFGTNPIVLVLQRVERKITVPAEGEETAPKELSRYDWVFAAPIVKNIPMWHAALDPIMERMAAQSELPPPDPNLVKLADLSAPYNALKTFLEASRAAGEEGGEFWSKARAQLDFTSVAAQRFHLNDQMDWPQAYNRAIKSPGLFMNAMREDETLRFKYVEALAAVINQLISDGKVDPESLEREATNRIKPTWAVGDGRRMVVLVRQGKAPGFWRFSEQTVLDAPVMAVGLVAVTTNQATTPVTPEITTPEKTTAATTPVVGTKEDPPSNIPLDFASPRATLRTFLDAIRDGDLRTAKRCMDLSAVSADDPGLADRLAGKLWLIINRRERPIESQIPDSYNAPPFDLLVHESGRIRINKLRSGERAGMWLFTERTVRDINRLYRALETEDRHSDWDNRRLPMAALPALYVREYMVPNGLKQSWWGLDIWQWLGLGAVFVSGMILQFILALVLPWFGRWFLRSPNVAMLPHVINQGFRPMATLAMVLIWLLGLRLLDLGNMADTGDSWILNSALEWSLRSSVRILQVVAIIVGARAIYMLIDVIMGYYNAKAAYTNSRVDDILVPLAQKTLKFVIVALGGILTVKVAFQLDVWPVFTGLGIGGFAVAFAAQDAIKNFFGSLSLVFDQPFRKGDWVIVSGVEGTIEHVGLRSSRIRTFYKSQVTIPNGEIMNAVVDNMGRRTMRRIKSMISVTYDTKAVALEAFVSGFAN
jgi:MscS family membrane protein